MVHTRSGSLVWKLLLLTALVLGAVVAPRTITAESPAPQPFELAKGDHIAIVGAGMAERIQHDGWLETAIQSRFPDQELVVRNIAHAGDELSVQLRVDGFGSEDEWLRRAKADVVFAFVGFNESFAGLTGLDKFKQDLAAFIKRITSSNYSGRGPARLVLFSPLAVEDIDPANLPGAADRNANIKLYTSAIAEVAHHHNVRFVDLFNASLKAYEASAEPLTINGVHQNERGNRWLATTIDHALFGPRPAMDDAAVAKLRQAILDKNFYWFQRYRHTDGYNIYGGRSHLNYDGLTNRTVMLREMEILEVMAANRDKSIWAAAQGRELAPDDSNLPPHIPVPTNKPGDGPEGQHRFLSGEDAIAKMEVAKGMKVQLFASEEDFPELVNPVQIAFDMHGRLWVAVWEDYTSWKVGTPLSARLLVLEDTDGDGKADKCTTFADNLWDPTGFEFWNDGVLIAQAPYLVYLKDTDGDGKADQYTRLLSHLSSGDSHHAANSFLLHGGWLYFGEGVFHRSQMESPYGTTRNFDGAIWRFNPRTFETERYVSYGFANPHGHSVDRWGQQIVTDGTGAQPYHTTLISGHLDGANQKHPRAPQVYQQRTRPLPATEILSSRHFPEELQGNFLVGNVIGFQGILQYRLEENGSSIRGVEVEPIVRSTDPNFRPVDLEVGPDGAIYFADWQNPIIGHMQHHVRDPSRDREHGRIYRVVYEGRPLLNPKPIADQPIEALLNLLKEPENRVRYRAQLELTGRDTQAVIAAARKWIDALSPNDADYEHHLLEALWLFQSHNVVNEPLLKQLLRAKDHRARAAATIVLCNWRDRIADTMALLRAAAEDEHPAVRLQAVRAASFFRDGAAADIALLALKRPTDEYINYVLGETMRQLDPFWKQALADGQTIAQDNPAGVAYLLERVSDAELINLPRTPEVYQAMLVRNGVPLAQRQEALEAIAKLNNTKPATELFKALQVADTAGAANTVAQLATILTSGELAADLKPMRQRLEEFAANGALAITRQLGYASLISVDGNVDAAWQLARGSAAGLREFAAATALVTNHQARQAMYPHLRTLARQLPQGVETSSGKGVQIDYFARAPRNATIEVFSRMRPNASAAADTIDFDNPIIAKGDTFAVRYTAKLFVPKGGEYTFFTRSDDGSRLYINKQSVVDNDGPHGTVEKSGKIHLEAGEHDLVITYYNGGGAYSFWAGWQPPGGEKQAIPADKLKGVTETQVRRAAVTALRHFPDRSNDIVTVLTPVLAEQELRNAAVNTLAELDESGWSADKHDAVAKQLVAYLSTLSVEDRADTDGRKATALASRVVDRLPTARGETYRRTLEELKIVTILVRPIRDAMLFDRPELYAQRGKPVQIIFENTDIMPHNFVIVAPGAVAEVGMAADAMAQDADAVKRNFIPSSNKVLHHTRLLMPGESDRILFTAPSDVEELPFLCSYPGHWLVMRGTLHIVDEVDPKLAQHEPAKVDSSHGGHAGHGHHGHGQAERAFVRNWTTADLAADLRRVSQGRSFERGKQVFSVAGCINCHKMGDEGAAIGPDLTKVSEKYSLPEILREIFEPSAVVNPDYRTWIIQTDWELVQGLIVKEDAESLHVADNLLNPSELKVIPKNEVSSRSEAPLSTMPNGLLVTFQKEEILDLLAYLQAGGDAKHANYKKDGAGHHHH